VVCTLPSGATATASVKVPPTSSAICQGRVMVA
jgi:hypothetical protein